MPHNQSEPGCGALERDQQALPVISGWIQETLGKHASSTKTVASFGFRRLPLYYSDKLLTQVKVVVVERVPVPPLESLGLLEFAEFEAEPKAGITYVDTYFLQSGTERDESLHFHELVHVVQWQTVGPERFLLAYANGLALHGYRDCPLEAMAYAHQDRFERDFASYDVESAVKAQTLDVIS